jgi:hypothetical protein
MHMLGEHHPDAVPFLAAGVHIAGVLDGHLGIGGVQAAHVLVVQAAFALDEDLPEGPVVGVVAHGLVVSCWLSDVSVGQPTTDN